VGLVCQTCGTDYGTPEPDAYRDVDGTVYLNLRKRRTGLGGVFDPDPSALDLWFTDTPPVLDAITEAGS
jgi:hypothetical protein